MTVRDNISVSLLWQSSPGLVSPPTTKEWTEICICPDLCVGTVRRALSNLEDTFKKELENLKEEGKRHHADEYKADRSS